MALLRDVSFTDYGTNDMALEACAELSQLGGFTGPRINGQVTPQTLFRGFRAGDVVGPYVSQFLLQPVYFGALPMVQTYTTYQAGLDYMTDASSWLAVQNGAGPFGSNVPDSQQRYLHDGRGVSAFVHVDLLFQAYFMGLLWLLRNASFNVGNPYNTSRTQIGFRHIWRSAYHQSAGGSFRVRSESAMVPEVLDPSRAPARSLRWPCPLHKDSRRQLSGAFRCPEFAGPGRDP